MDRFDRLRSGDIRSVHESGWMESGLQPMPNLKDPIDMVVLTCWPMSNLN